MNSVLTILAIGVILGCVVQVAAIIKIANLRRQFGRSGNLEQHPVVRVWMRTAGVSTFACSLAAIIGVILAKEGGEPFLLGLITVALLLIAYEVADNNPRPNSDDSGG